MNEKLKLKAGKYLRGYIPPASSTMKKSGIKDTTNKANNNASFAVMPELNDDLLKSLANTAYGGINHWPNVLADFKPTIVNYIDALSFLSSRLLQAFALALQLKQDALQHLLIPQHMTTLRMLHYPLPQGNEISGSLGFAAHSDYGLFTLVAQDQAGGLQVRTSDDKYWLDVTPKPSSLVLNSADMMMRLSNGIFKSTPHRVLNPINKERFSLAYFLTPNLDAPITPFDKCIKQTGGKALYQTTSYREYFNHVFASNYGLSS